MQSMPPMQQPSDSNSTRRWWPVVAVAIVVLFAGLALWSSGVGDSDSSPHDSSGNPTKPSKDPVVDPKQPSSVPETPFPPPTPPSSSGEAPLEEEHSLSGYIARFDKWLQAKVTSYRAPWLDKLACVIAQVGAPLYLFLIACTILVVYDLSAPSVQASDTMPRKKKAPYLGVSFLGALAFGSVLKAITKRKRPDHRGSPRGQEGYSFPSGHTLMAGVILQVAASLLAEKYPGCKALWHVVALLTTAVVAWSRLYLRVHWPTDVLASFAISHVWAYFAIPIGELLCQVLGRMLA